MTSPLPKGVPPPPPPAKTKAETERYIEAAANAPPVELGAPSPTDPQWTADQVKAGMATADMAPAVPEGVLPVQPPTSEGEDPVLVRASLPEETTKVLRGKTKAMDDQLGQQDWEAIYTAYADSGDIETIAAATGRTPDAVKHLLDWGVRRLGLKPIREQAVDYGEVALRSQALVKRAEKSPNELYHLQQQREAAIDRVAQETAVTQGALTSTLRTVDSFLGYVNAVLEKTKRPGGYKVPDEISANLLHKLSQTASNLTNSVDKVARLSRFIAGEPERNVLIEVAALVGRMNPDELAEFHVNGSLPSHVRSIDLQSTILDAQFEEVEAPPAPPPPRPPEEE